MRKWKTLILTAALTVGIGCLTGAKAQASSVKIDQANFPDASIRTYVTQYDTNKDGALSDEERNKMISFRLDYDYSKPYGIKEGQIVDFTGMQNFPNITVVCLDLEYEVSNKKICKWNYDAVNLMKSFPNMDALHVTTREGQKIVLRGTSKKLTQLECYAYNNDRPGSGIDSTLYAPNVKNLVLWGKWLQNNKNIGKKFPNAKKVELPSSNLGGGNTFKGMKKVEQLVLDAADSDSVNVQPLRATLKEFWLGDMQASYFAVKCKHSRLESQEPNIMGIKINKKKAYTLDLSGMQKLERVYACGEQKIKAVKLWDNKTKKGAPKLKDLQLYGAQITAMDATGAPKLERLFVGNTIQKLNVNNNKKLRELGLISNQKLSLKIANKNLKYLRIIGKKMKKIDIKKCSNLVNLSMEGVTVGQLDCRKNRHLHSLYLSNSTVKQLYLPKVQKSKMLSKYIGLTEPGATEGDGEPLEYASYKGYGFWENTKINVMDLSGYKKLNNYIKKFQLGNGFGYYNKWSENKTKIKKIVINKNLRKSDKKWVKKMAKKQKIKVVEK
ncbi:MAG: hypothetical protein MR316_07020 [Lachnospiraceae bacterium]|nr:hypothetical protein [Lachnospiraceae bacterium]